MCLFLTSALNTYKKINGKRIGQDFGNKNGILVNLKKAIHKYDNFLFVCGSADDFERNDDYSNAVIESFKITLPFNNYFVLDSRTSQDIEKLVCEADMIYIGGGHLPSQNQFFKEINLKKYVKNTNAVIIAGSAGSMNCAKKVYCLPELPGEALSDKFNKELEGLGLTDINIFPHYDLLKSKLIDGKEYEKDILIPDSYDFNIYACEEDAYIIQKDHETEFYGNVYLFKNGDKIKLRCFP